MNVDNFIFFYILRVTLTLFLRELKKEQIEGRDFIKQRGETTIIYRFSKQTMQNNRKLNDAAKSSKLNKRL